MFLPFIVVYLLLRAYRDRRYLQSLAERFGWLPRTLQGTGGISIWLHAVSVGEVLSSFRLIERLRTEYPALSVYVSSTTLAGKALAKEKLAGLASGVFYAPLDYGFVVRKILRSLRPSLVIVVETEIWPNLYREIKRSGAGLLIVNGRISDRAMPRYASLAWFLRPVLSLPDAILLQNDIAAGRYLELGAPPERARVVGNLKYDFDPGRSKPPAVVLSLLRRIQAWPVWIAASTMPPAGSGDVDEDEVVLDTFVRLAERHPRLLLILVPRRPERFESAAASLRARGSYFLRRSQLTDESVLPLPGVLLLDSIGELSGLFSVGDVVFMGGTLAQRGGHNVLEPAFFGCPVIVGPHMENFPDIAAELINGGGLVRISKPSELESRIHSLLNDPLYRGRIGERARELAIAKRGATDQALGEIGRLLEISVPRTLRPIFVRALLWPLVQLWRVGLALDRMSAHPKRLLTPVVSVGGIGAGGAGKTPLVLHLTESLKTDGRKPAILTRGYRRRHPERSTILAPGEEAPVSATGDEAQLFLRAAAVPVGIGANRYATGVLLENRFHPDVILLDDGFQHWRLARSVDIVLIDALDPFAGDALLPLGRLREPLTALERADVFLITRAVPGSATAGIERRLRELNPVAQIFRSRVVPLNWVNIQTGETLVPSAITSKAALAFCGLANPASFWQTLSELGCRPAERRAFADHYIYGSGDIASLAGLARSAGCEVLLTTEKDRMNLPEGTANAVSDLDLLYLKIGIRIEDEPLLIALLDEKLGKKVQPKYSTGRPSAFLSADRRNHACS